MSKVISIIGRGKIEFSKEKDKDKMDKKYPDVEFEKMNSLTFTTTYKGNNLFDLKIKVGSTEIPCSFKKFAWPWKYGSILALEPHFEDLGKKADIRISGGIQGKLFKFFRYDYEKMLKDNPQRQKSIKLKAKANNLTNKQKKAINAHLIQKYSYKKWAESLSDKADPELLKEYNKILKNPDFLEKIKKTKKKGGGKTKVKPDEFKKMISEMEGSAMKDNQKCNTSCYKIKTNHAKDKKKLQLKRKCHQGCEKKRMKTVKAFHKQYPKEFNVFVKSLGGGGKGPKPLRTKGKSESISGKGKIFFIGDADRKKMAQKYPDVEFEKMNSLTFTATYMGKENYKLIIKIGDTEIPCSFKFDGSWLYQENSINLFRFNDLKRKKTGIHVTGGIQKDLINYLKYEYERPIYSAAKYIAGTIKRGNDGNLWTNRKKKNEAKWFKIKKKKTKRDNRRKGGGGSKKETKYICYDGIGSNKTGTHTEKEFLQVMKKNKDNFNENPPKNIKTADQWMKWAGGSRGRCKTKKQPIKLTDKQIRGTCKKSCNKGRNDVVKSLKAMDKILKVKNFKELNKKSLKMYDKTCVKSCTDIAKDPKKMKQALNEIKKIQGKMNEGKIKISL